MMRIIIIQILSILLLTSCSTGKSTTGIDHSKSKSDKIDFLSFTIERQYEKIKIKEIDRNSVSGKIKIVPPKPENFSYPVEVIFLDQSLKRLFSTFIEHPLINIYEFSSPNGELGKTTQFLDSADFFLRFNHNDLINYIWFASESSCPIPLNQKLKINQ